MNIKTTIRERSEDMSYRIDFSISNGNRTEWSPIGDLHDGVI